jgi:hypothetical protein
MTTHNQTGDFSFMEQLRPSMIRKLAQGQSSWTSVDMLVCDTGFQGYAMRAGLEQLGIKVNFFPVGLAQHLVNVLSGAEATAPYVIIDTHGDEGDLLLPELAPEYAATQRFNGRLTAGDLATFVNLPGRVVISLGCDTGDEALARVFLDHGCIAYIGPQGAPFGYSSYFFPVFLFYELTHNPGRSLADALAHVCAHDNELGMFRLYTKLA